MSEQHEEQYGHYSMILEWEPTDRIYVVTVPELPGCHTHAATLVEAVRQGQDAIESWIDVARELGRPIPRPRYFALDPVDSHAEEALGVR